MYMVCFVKLGKIFLMSGVEMVLLVVCKVGVVLLLLCSQGICGICKIVVFDGMVDMQYNGGICQWEIDKGLCLMCCSCFMLDFVFDLQWFVILMCVDFDLDWCVQFDIS